MFGLVLNFLPMLRNIPWKLVAIVAIAFLLLYAGWHARGVIEENRSIRIENERLKATQEENRRLTDELNTVNSKFTKEMNDAKTTIDTLRRDVRNGAVRLSVPVPTCAGSSPGAGADSGEARAELDRATSEDLIGITADGDDAIIQLNACIDILNRERQP